MSNGTLLLNKPNQVVNPPLVNPELTLSSLDFQTWVDLITNTELLGFDTETSGLLVYDQQDRMLGFSVAVKVENYFIGDYFPCQHIVLPGGTNHNLPEEAWRYLLSLVVSKTLVIHNSIFDKKVVQNEGFEITKFIDTMKYEHLLNENYKTYDLDSVTLRRLGYKGKDKNPMFEMAKLAYGWDMPAEYIYDYAKADGIEVLKAAYAQVEVAKKQNEVGLNKYWSTTEAPSITALTWMRGWGVEIDTEICKREEEKGEAERERVTDFFGFNPGSSLGLKKLLIDELGLPIMYNVKKNKATGESVASQTFDKKAMERYEVMIEGMEDRGENKEIVKELLLYRGWTKSVSSYYRPYQKLLSPDGRLRPEYKPHGTKTGRWSCADPNLQQIPKETDKVWNGAIKDCLVSASGYTGWEIDYSQLEFRLAASASHSDNLLEIFADPHRDIFTEMAKMLNWSRNACKTLTYSTLYGAGVTRIMDAFGVNQQDATDLIEHFYSVYPNLRLAGKSMAVNAARSGYVDIWSGRRRHFEYPKKENFKAFNSFIQGGAADIVKTVIIDCFKEVVNEECKLLLQVHDSLWFEIAEGKETYYLPKIMEIMSRPSDKFGVPLTVDAHPWSRRESLAIPETTKQLLGLAA